VDMGRIAKDEIDISFMRWLYTAVTRATEKLYLIQFSDDYFK
jgi:exodeoxyribonuclease-5